MWKIQSATDVVLQTYAPINHEVSYGFAVTREPSVDGYRIGMTLQCGNLLGCDLQPADVRRAFYHYVVSGQDVLGNLGYVGSIR